MKNNQIKLFRETMDGNAWFERYGNYLYRYALWRLREPSLAEEKIQETFLAALNARARFKGRASERTWLVSILKHKIIDYYREKKQYQSRFAMLPGNSQDYIFERKIQWKGNSSGWILDPDEAFEQKEFLEILNRCLSEMPQRLSLAFTYREIYGLSTREICKLMNVTIGNLYVMLHRARLKLKRFMVLHWVDGAVEKDAAENTEKDISS